MRIRYLDGLRGWAAIVVLLSHVIEKVYGEIYPFIHNTAFAWFVSGSNAVHIFFLISGEAIATSVMDSSKFGFWKKSIKRYIRLTVPIFASCILIYLLMSFGFTYNHEIERQLHSSNSLLNLIPFQPDPLHLLKYSFWDVYVLHRHEDITYNPVLWTMSTEIMGSIAIYAYYKITSKVNRQFFYPLIIAIALFKFNSGVSLFFVGAMFAELRKDEIIEFIHKIPKISIFAGALIVLSILVDPFFNNGDRFLASKSAILIFVAFLISPLAHRFMNNKVSQFLGQISFPLYLTHFAVIFSFQCSMVKMWASLMPMPLWYAGITAFGTILISLALATAVMPLENKWNRFISRF